ncbi:MAG TPA: 4Fe-4S dicluster domain-containing protein [Candidatus Melainabacteria bacterium]|nr:4Fe-4S dicluster domain-containing protein [Candidatus Melainabacteria bacterium]HIN63112.1 4Fe-4S dicluster domain-containing protein [Candidatus Obscuribacterales bacterium]
MLQHVTDPETCISCSACEMACPLSAIISIGGRFCIDAEKCNDCGRCVDECPTGAADCYVRADKPYTQEAQASWQRVPSESCCRNEARKAC